MMVAAARCLLLSPVCCSPSSATLRLPRIIRPPRSSCSASPLAVVASMHAPPQGYRTNVGICLANPSLTKIFSASRIDIPSAWQMPQGGIDEGEDPRVAAVRELKEETGVTSAEIVAEVKLTGTPCKLGVCLVCSRLETLLHVFSANIFWHARWDTKEANMTSTEKSATTADIDFDAIIVPTLADLTSEQRKEIEDRKAALEEVMLGCYQKTRWGVTQKTALPMLNPIGDDSIPTKPAPNWLTYDFPPDVREKLNARWGTDWKGQAQKWFLLRFTGKDDEINLNSDGSEKPEFSEWTWMTPQQVIEKAVDFKKPVYEEALKHFAPYLQSDPTASS